MGIATPGAIFQHSMVAELLPFCKRLPELRDTFERGRFAAVPWQLYRCRGTYRDWCHDIYRCQGTWLVRHERHERELRWLTFMKLESQSQHLQVGGRSNGSNGSKELGSNELM